MKRNLRIQTFIILVSIIAILSTSLFAQRKRVKKRGGASSSAKVIKTNIDVHYQSRIDASDQIIAFGTGFLNGVSYIKPGETNATPVPNSNNYSSKFFVAIGTKIVLAKPDFTMAVFDTATKTMTEIPESNLKLRSIGGDMFTGGSIQRSGNYAAVITDLNSGDNSVIKVIDVSGAEPRIIRFEGSGVAPNRSKALVRQVAVDAKTAMVAVVSGREYEMKIYDINNPNKAPKIIDLTKYRGVGKNQMAFDNGKILFLTGESKSKAVILDVATGNFTEMTLAYHNVALAGGKFVYFANRGTNDYKGNSSRAVVGNVGTKPRLSNTKSPIGGSPNNGIVGFGATAAITPNGKNIFIAGWRDIGQTERFQSYRGGRFVTQRDATARPAILQGSDIVASSKIVALKVGRNNSTKLGYIKLK